MARPTNLRLLTDFFNKIGRAATGQQKSLGPSVTTRRHDRALSLSLQREYDAEVIILVFG